MIIVVIVVGGVVGNLVVSLVVVAVVLVIAVVVVIMTTVVQPCSTRKCITALPCAHACALCTCETRHSCAHTQIMTSLPKRMIMLLNVSTNMHTNLRNQLTRTPMPEALLLGASTMAFLPCAGIMDSISGGIGVTKVSYHTHGLFFVKCSNPLAEWVSHFHGMGFSHGASCGMGFWACTWNGFPSHLLQRNEFRSGFGNIILLAYTDD